MSTPHKLTASERALLSGANRPLLPEFDGDYALSAEGRAWRAGCCIEDTADWAGCVEGIRAGLTLQPQD